MCGAVNPIHAWMLGRLTSHRGGGGLSRGLLGRLTSHRGCGGLNRGLSLVLCFQGSPSVMCRNGTSAPADSHLPSFQEVRLKPPSRGSEGIWAPQGKLLDPEKRLESYVLPPGADPENLQGEAITKSSRQPNLPPFSKTPRI